MTSLTITLGDLTQLLASLISIGAAVYFSSDLIRERSGSKKIEELLQHSDLGSAAKKELKETYDHLQHRSVLFSILLAAAAVLAIIIFFFKSDTDIKAELINSDKNLFHQAGRENVEYARTIPSRAALESETNFSESIKSTKTSFWIMTNSFSRLASLYGDVLDCINRGVQVKILLIDTATERSGQKNAIYSRIEYHKTLANFGKTLDLYDSLRVKAVKAKGGNIQLKIYKEQMTCQMWLRDANDTINGLAHVNILSNPITGFSAHFRITPCSSYRLFANLADEFNKCWDNPTNTIY